MDQLFLGNEQMSVDDKGRVGIPARFMAVLRAICPNEADSVGVMITPDRSIKVMPIPYFAAEIESWSKFNDRIDEERMMLNLSTSMAERMALDKQNRFKLNPLMRELCMIDQKVVIQGSMNYMQIFDAAAWREMFNKNLARWGQASTHVALKNEPKAPVQQFVITTGGGQGEQSGGQSGS